MQTLQQILPDVFYVGASEGRHPLFENIYPVPNGMSYNSYLITDSKTALLDTCDSSVREQFLSNLETALAGRDLDYLIVHHMEPDHAGLIDEILCLYPRVQIVCNAKTQTIINQFFQKDISHSVKLVQEGDTLSLGRQTLSFYMAPMVHWPEVMVSYEHTNKILFSADAFGTFGELNGSLFADSYNQTLFLPEARRYYTNIVGKYGPSVQQLLKKAGSLDIQMICPLHGPIWRQDLGWFLNKYDRWSSYSPEEKGVLIAYGSIYGHTENTARALANALSKQGIENIALYDASKTHPSYLIAESFRLSHIVIASVTYNNGIFPPIETFLLDLKAHNIQNRSFYLIQNGSWAPNSGKQMHTILSETKSNVIDENIITIKSALIPEQSSEIEAMAIRISQKIKEK